MKNALLAFLSGMGILYFVVSIPAQSTFDLSVPHITVTGKAEIIVEPDTATISVDFTKLNKDLQSARKENEEGVVRMLQIARRYSIPQEDIITNNISVSKRYVSIRDPQRRIYDEDGDEIGTRVFQGYEVSRSVTIRLKKLELFDVVFNEILDADPTEISTVRFESSRIIELRETAREMAMKADHEKAKAMTSAIGQNVGKALRISEGTASDRYFSVANVNSNALNVVTAGRSELEGIAFSSSLAAFSAGSINIEASVTVIFHLG
jgi:uncharacterized protein YggE